MRDIEHCDFVDAVRTPGRHGPGSPSATTPRGKDQPDREGARPLLARHGAGGRVVPRAAAEPAGRGAARHYLRSRGYDGEIVRQFRLGWAPEAWQTLVRRAPGAPRTCSSRPGSAHKGQTACRTPSGAGSSSRSSTRPGKAIGAGRQDPARAPAEGAGPKYKNSPETPIYSKRRTLYALNWAKQDIIANRRGHRLRGVHRRDRLLQRRRAAGGGHLRDGAGRGALPPARELRQPDRPRLRRRRRRPVGRCPLLRVGEASRTGGRRCRPCPPAATRQISQCANRRSSGRRSSRRGRSSHSGWNGPWPRASSRPERAGHTRRKLLLRWSPSTPMNWFAINTWSPCRTGRDSTPSDSDLVSTRSCGLPRCPAARPPVRPARRRRAVRPELRRGTPLGTGPGAHLGPPSAQCTSDGERFQLEAALWYRAIRRACRPGRSSARGSRAASHGWATERGSVRRPAPACHVHGARRFEKPARRHRERRRRGGGSLRRLAVTEPDADPDQTVAALARAAAQVALGEIEADARQAEAEADATRLAAAGAAITWLKSELELMQEPGTADGTSPAVSDAANRLVAWLLQRYLEAR